MVLLFWVRVDLGVIKIKGGGAVYITQSSRMELHYQIQFRVTPSISLLRGGIALSKGYNQRILSFVNIGRKKF